MYKMCVLQNQRTGSSRLLRVMRIATVLPLPLLLMGCLGCLEPSGTNPWMTAVSYDDYANDYDNEVKRTSWYADKKTQSGTVVEAPAPKCKVEPAPKPAAGQAGASADPNLVEIARLEMERDCYKQAEQRARDQLNTR
jgi:hypothetical protein